MKFSPFLPKRTIFINTNYFLYLLQYSNSEWRNGICRRSTSHNLITNFGDMPMKKVTQVTLMLLLMSCFIFAQRAKIVIENVTPYEVEENTSLPSSVSTGLHVVGNQTAVYLAAQDIENGDAVTSATFTFSSKPAGSVLTDDSIKVLNATWVYFIPDLTGEYVVNLSMTTAVGTDDTTQSIIAANYVGVGDFAGVAATGPNCMTCHKGVKPELFGPIFDKWKVSGHANIFNEQINTSTHYSTDCMKCHTTGYDHNLVAANNGFDDIAASLGWTYVPPSNPGKWDTLVTMFPTLVNHATIGCESCHGPGSVHASTFSAKNIEISLKAGVCGSCHDEPWRHDIYRMYENSVHSEALWSSSFARTNTDNSIGSNCSRCHDAAGYVAFNKGEIYDAASLTEADHTPITCQACHDPHGSGTDYSLRPVPAGSDTLGNGYSYSSIGGVGQVCMNCHKARRDNVSYVVGNSLSSHWGPHGSVQTDNILGQNAASFDGSAFLSGSHKYAITNACVDCHMTATADTGTVERDKVGGHSWVLHDEATDYYHTSACVNCHGPKTSWNDFEAASDYDGDGTVESIPEEVDGLLHALSTILPPTGVDSIAYQDIQAEDNITLRKAWWNYQLIANDGSKGMHNTKFAVNVLTKTIAAVGGVVPVELVSFEAAVNQGLVTLKWQTATETNNNGFEIERKSGNSWNKIGFVKGSGTSSNLKNYSYTDKSAKSFDVATYRLKQVDFNGKANYSKEVEVVLNTAPKEFSLSQNYPNPFNPNTIIKYSIPFESKVKIVIYNLTGEVVNTLVNTTEAAGTHEANFNTNSSGLNLSSGIYFYSMEAVSIDGSQTFRQTKKMILMK